MPTHTATPHRPRRGPLRSPLAAATQHPAAGGMQPFVVHGRKTSSASSSSSRRRSGRAAAGRDQTAGVRAWAKDKGIHVNDRGRIPAPVVKEYEAAH